MTKIRDSYLGDGVYAHFNGFGIALDLRAQENPVRTIIHLDWSVIESLNRFVKHIKEQVESST